MTQSVRFKLRVAPGILGDESFGVYLTSVNDSSLEVQLGSQFSILEEAYTAALFYKWLVSAERHERTQWVNENEIPIAYVAPSEIDRNTDLSDIWKKGRDCWKQKLLINQPSYETEINSEDVDSDIDICLSRNVDIESEHTEEKPERLKKLVTDYFKDKPSLSLWSAVKKWYKSKILISIIAIIIFSFDLSVTIPIEFPLITELRKPLILGASQLALILPIAMLIIIVKDYLHGRVTSLKEAAILDLILLLATKHSWNRDDFNQLSREIFGESTIGWLNKLLQDIKKSKEEKIKSKIILPESGMSYQLEINDSHKKEERKMLEAQDFENRIHSLYIMTKCPDYRPFWLSISVLSFIVNPIRVESYLATHAVLNFLNDHYYVRNHYKSVVRVTKSAWLGFLLPYSIIIISLIWALVFIFNSAWPAVISYSLFFISMMVLFIPAYRVHMVLIRKRGFPRNCFLYDSYGGILI